MEKYIKLNEDNMVVGVSNAVPVGEENDWILTDDPSAVIGSFKQTNGSFSNTEVLWAEVRAKRNNLLAETDWTQLPDVLANGRLTAEKVQEFAEYRQTLANITEAFNSPEDVVFPTKP